MAKTTSDSILGVIWKESWILDHFEIFVNIALYAWRTSALSECFSSLLAVRSVTASATVAAVGISFEKRRWLHLQGCSMLGAVSTEMDAVVPSISVFNQATHTQSAWPCLHG